MKKKFSRILGVALTLALLASMFGFAAPVAAQAGDQTWAAQTLPTGTGNVIVNDSDIGDIAVSSDGTIYVINNDDAIDAITAGSVLRSTDGGRSFTACPAVTTDAAVTGRFLNAIAVAPDDSSVVMVTDGLDCYLSTDSGSTWTTLGTDAVNSVAANTEILDVDVSPAIAGALFGRHYVRAVSDGTSANITSNGAQLIGVRQSDWTSITKAFSGGDGLAVKFSPSYVGDRALAFLYTNNTDTYFDIISQPEAAAETRTQSCTITAIASTNYEAPDLGASKDALVVGDIALPSDWDPTLTAGQVSYISVGTENATNTSGTPSGRGGANAISTGVAGDDVYRIDANAAVALGGTTTLPIHSIAYQGTIAEGTLFLGERASSNVKWTLNPTSSAPTWTSTSKAPTGDDSTTPENCTKVVVAPNGDIYAGTRDIWWDAGSDERSAFSVSTDDGKTFNQTAIINIATGDTDDDVVAIDDFMVTPDGETVFMATSDAVNLSLWTSSLPTGSDTWERIYCRPQTGTATGIVRLSPDYADNPSIFWADVGAAKLYVSHDGGAIFANRTPPAWIVDLAIESGGSTGVCYMSNGTDVYKSTNGGYWFGLAEPTAVTTAATSLSMAPMYPALPETGHLIVGGTGSVSYSTDSADSFTSIDTGLAGVCRVGADEAYATNNTIYAAGGATVYRFAIGTDSSWTNLTAGAGTLQGLGVSNGVLYAADTGAVAADAGVWRTLGPLDAAGTLAFEQMNTGAGAAATFTLTPNSLRVVNNVLYAVDTAPTTVDVLNAYDDFLATAVPVQTGPAGGATVLVDPVSGRAIDTVFTWEKMGAGDGLVTDFEFQIAEAGTNFGGPLIQSYSAVTTTTGLTGSNTTGLDSTNPVFVVGSTGQWNQNLRANTEYEWRIRARDTVAADTIRGQWSESRVISIQAGGIVEESQVGPQLQGPAPGATDVSVNPGFSWSPIAGATLYRLWLALDSGLTLTVEGTPVDVTDPSWQVPSDTLEYDTTYFWGVQSIEPTESVRSIGTFRTMSIDVYACPFCDETFGSMGALDSHIAAVHPSATPAYIWAIIVIGAVLMIAVIMLIVKTRRVV